MSAPLSSQTIPFRHQLRNVVIVLVVSLSAVWGGRTWYEFELRGVRSAIEHEINAVSALVSAELAQWRTERLGDGKVLVEGSFVRQAVSRLRASQSTGADRSALRARLQSFHVYQAYDAAFVVDERGVSLLREPENSPDFPEPVRDQIARIIAAGQPELVDFYLDPRDGQTHLALVSPIGRAAVVLRIEPDIFVHPLLEAWPGQSDTAENYLVRRDGNDVLFLNNLRFAKDAAMRQRAPLGRSNLLDAQAALGARGPVEGVDYAGQPSMGRVAAVAGSPWLVISRVQLKEIDAAARALLWPIVITVSLIIISATLGTFAISLSEKARFQEREGALVAARERASAAVRDLVRTSPTIVYKMREINGQFAPTEVSENIERLTGFTAAEALAPGWWAGALHPEDLVDASVAIARLATEDDVSHEFRFTKKDGQTVWVHDQITVTRRDHGRPVEVTGSWSDVTERRTAEAQLHASESRLRLALRATKQGLIDIDLATGTTVVSREYAELLEQDPATFIESTAAWTERLHPDDRVRGTAEFTDYLAGKTPSYRSESRQRVSGGWKWILTLGEIIERHADGRPLRFIGTATDITDLKTAQLEAQSSARLYAALSRSNEAIVRSRTAEELFPQVCQAAVESGAADMAWIGLVGERAPLLTKAARHGHGVEYVDRIEVSVAPDDKRSHGPTGTCIRENRPVWTQDFLRNPMTELWHAAGAAFGWRVSASLPLHRNGVPIGALTLYSASVDQFSESDRRLMVQLADDITFALEGFERERARSAMEAALEESEQRYRTLFEDASVPVILLDATTGHIVDANAAAAAMYGWDRPQLRQMHIADLNVLGREEIAVELARTRVSHQQFNFRHRTARGVVIDVEAFSTPVRLNERQLILATLIDVSARKRAQDALQVSERSLRESLREKEALLKEVHHRVKNNLQVVNSLMRLEVARNADPAVKRVLGEMQSRILSMAILHETLYRGGNFAQIDLARYLGQLTNQIFRSSIGTGHRVALHTEFEPALVNLEQAVPCGLLLNELLSNTLKHAFPNQRSGQVRVTLQVSPADRGITMQVADDGVGLPANWEKRRESSLGLQLVGDLTRQLQGTMTIGTSPGTSFTLRFIPATREVIV